MKVVDIFGNDTMTIVEVIGLRIRSIRLTEFKRFTDLTIEGIPDTAKLVILVGPSGSGKSSLLDAINTWGKDYQF